MTSCERYRRVLLGAGLVFAACSSSPASSSSHDGGPARAPSDGPCTQSADCYGNDQNPAEAICYGSKCCALTGFSCSKDEHCCNGTCKVPGFCN